MKSAKCTILYYTSNREDESFEKKIRSILLKINNDRYPIISISQKPIDLGRNICVGDVGVSDHNIYRQIQIGCQEAKTPFIISAEADNLYPHDYFNFIPEKIDVVCRYKNIWILKYWRTVFVRKPWCEGAQIIGREYYLDLIEKELAGKPQWLDGHYPTNPFRYLNRGWDYYGTEIPVISFKTGKGLRSNTWTTNSDYTRILPYWGSVSTVRRKLRITRRQAT